MKRIANKDLNRDNWDEEDAPEERGRFNVAEGDILSKRKFLTIKRKQSSNQSEVFKSFGGFITQNTEKTFSNFLNKPEIINNDNREKHLNNLKHLNRLFIENIQKYVLENECCILSPLFEDYQRHISTINSKYPLNIKENSNNEIDIPKISSKIDTPIIPKIDNSVTKSEIKPFGNFPSSTFSFGSNNITSSIVTPSITLTNSTQSLFGEVKDGNSTSTSLFGARAFQPNDESKPFGIFPSFGGDKSKDQNVSLFGNSTFQVKPQDEVVKEDTEEYIPPKAETRNIKESDSVFDIRCKLFYLNDKDWKEKGVGNLFIKPLSSGRCQLVMRADNTLGTILLNILLTKAMPLTVNKNNLSLVAITDFGGDESKSTSLLIRVKTADNAEQLLGAIKNQVDNE